MIRNCTLSIFIIAMSSFYLFGTGSNTGQSIYINCPSDKWVYCDQLSNDLDTYGLPDVTSSYNYTIDEWAPEYHLSGCSIGYIKRKWKITDHHDYRVYYCEQRITVKAHEGSIAIDWPDDYITYECEPNLDPTYLPVKNGYPTIEETETCSNIYVGYKDYILYNSSDVCYKILREWTVIDWCVYTPNSGSSNGKWIYEQFLKIKSNEQPSIYCPKDTIIAVDRECDGAYVNLPLTTGSSKCDSETNITNDSPYADNNGPDASGYYPLGDTWIKFTIDDLCGNKTHCKTKITVKDLTPPTVICKYGISTPLAQMHDGYYTDLWPMEFNNKSYDNCTPESQLTFEISLDRVTCDNLGENDVYLKVTDKSGNSTTCRSFIIVQDNQNLCQGSAAPYSISGYVANSNDNAIGEVQISLNGDISENIMSDQGGNYSYTGMNHLQDYIVRPFKSSNINEGLSSMDMINLIWHIVGKSEITDPYQLVAGDVNNSGLIDIQDVIQLRNVLLGLDEQFPNNTSWRFNLASNNLYNSTTAIPKLIEEYLVEAASSDMENLDFVAIKTGDVDQSMFANNSISGRASDKKIELSPRIDLQANRLSIPINLGHSGILDIMIDYDGSVLEFDDLNWDATGEIIQPVISDNNDGKVRIYGYGDLSNVKVNFRINSTIEDTDDIYITSISGEIIDNEGDLTDIRLGFDFKSENRELNLNINPNPFSDYIYFSFYTHDASPFDFFIYDAFGRKLYSMSGISTKGDNSFHVDTKWRASSLTTSGLHYYKLINADKILSGQIVKIE